MIPLQEIVIGLVALLALMFAAEQAVKRILNIITHYGFSDTFAGLTVFSIGTSFPEIFAHLAASIGILRTTLDYKIASATVLGANIGSDVIQQTLVVGIVVLLMGGFMFSKDFLRTAYLLMVGVHLITLALAWDRTVTRIDGLILSGLFVVYMAFLYRREKDGGGKRKRELTHVPRNAALAAASMVVMLISAHFLLKSTEAIVKTTGLGGSLIGVISLGVAAAAPEMFTAFSSIRNKATGIALGTLIGSNITNPLVGIGLGAVISTYWVPRGLIYWDLPMEVITAALLLAYLLFNKGKLGRVGGAYLVGLYLFYLVVRMLVFPVDL